MAKERTRLHGYERFSSFAKIMLRRLLRDSSRSVSLFKLFKMPIVRIEYIVSKVFEKDMKVLMLKVILFFFLFSLTTSSAFCEIEEINPPFPRIANVYGASLAPANWSIDGAYLQKLSLIIGGCWDFWYDWDMPAKIDSLESTLSNMTTNITNIKTADPHALVLPYILIDNALDNPLLPSNWWRLDDEGQRISTWPGFYQIKYELPEVLEYNLEKVRDVILSKDFFDGIFYDSCGVDNWLVPETTKLRDGKAVVMFNDWNLPSENFDRANGALSEDEINRIIDGEADFENFLNRYIRWTSECRKPTVTTIVCHPRSVITDLWIWNSMTDEERATEMDKACLADEQTMRFGLATALMGDGYFAYDYGINRGTWWWYKEYDVPLGYPKGVAYKNSNGTWQRDYEGGTVIVNGTTYDAVINFSFPHTDVSTEEVSQHFTLPSFDGRIFTFEQVSGCTYSIGHTNAHYSSPGGTGNVKVTTSDNQCSWTATNNESWITITSGNSGIGNGTVSFSVLANVIQGSRTGTMSIAGDTFTVTQDGTCIYYLIPTNQSFGSSGGTGRITVTTQSGCTWNASSNASWVTIISGSNGTGSGTVNYSVSANTSTIQRIGILTIAGQTFTVTQSASTCNYLISTTSQSFISSGGEGSVDVTTQSGCSWTAKSNTSWITISSDSTGMGNGTVNYSVLPNAIQDSRTGTMNIAGETLTVVQEGVEQAQCSTWTDVINKHTAYVSGQADWSVVITCYTQYDVSP